MKERPILMSAPMVRACLDGSKTQTRRIAPVESFDIKDAGNEMVTWAISFSKAVGPSRSLASYSGGRYSADDATRIVASHFAGMDGKQYISASSFRWEMAEKCPRNTAQGDVRPNADEPARLMAGDFVIGGIYRCANGDIVRMCAYGDAKFIGTFYETMSDELGVHRYTNRAGSDLGRVTGSAPNEPRNIVSIYSLPAPTPAERAEFAPEVKGDAGGWIEWKGGPIPLALDAKYEARRRNGDTFKSRASPNVGPLSWGHTHTEIGLHVVAYRLVA